jgi:hypothetical protein
MSIYNLYFLDLLAKTEKYQIFIDISLHVFDLIIDLFPIKTSNEKKKEHKIIHLMFNQNTKLNNKNKERNDINI